MSGMKIAILGATGGCALSCLDQALNSEDVASIKCLVRTSPKLASLLEKRTISPEVIQAKLQIIQGDAKSIEDVKKCIEAVDIVVTAVGTLIYQQI